MLAAKQSPTTAELILFTKAYLILKDTLIPILRNLNGEMVADYHGLDSLPGLDLKIAIASPTKVKN